MVNGTSFRDMLLRDSSASTGAQGAAATPATETKKKNDQLGKTEFLNLLVTQLKNQDPMEPMKNDQFAVNLAQFSQLEQLIGINEKIGSDKADLSSMSAYLGHDVTLNSDVVSVKNNNGGSIKFELPGEASAVKIELQDPVTGSVQESIDVGPMTGGKHTVELASLSTSSGNYRVKIQAISAAGGESTISAKVGGLVNGFIPGPTPKLLMNGFEIDPSQVIEVSMPS